MRINIDCIDSIYGVYTIYCVNHIHVIIEGSLI